MTICFVTHESDIAAFTKRNVVFRDGQIIKDINVINNQNASKALLKLIDNKHKFELTY